MGKSKSRRKEDARLLPVPGLDVLEVFEGDSQHIKHLQKVMSGFSFGSVRWKRYGQKVLNLRSKILRTSVPVAQNISDDPETLPPEFLQPPLGAGSLTPQIDLVARRKVLEVNSLIRDRGVADKLKKIYGDTCMVCDVRLQVGVGLYYSEAAHIKPLGQPHNGPDSMDNMLVLCPNHHVQFDRGVLQIERSSGGFIVHDKSKCLETFVLSVKHEINHEYVDWHRNWFSGVSLIG